MEAGISSISIYVPPLYLAHDDLADTRGIPRDKYRVGLGNISMSIVPPWDDTVTMAANAAEMVIESSGINKDEIGLLIVCTESSVDQSKPVASYVQGLLNIGPRTRVYEIKHACYSGTVGIMNAVNWINSQCNDGRKALVIASDIARYGLNTLGEPTQGAGAIACVISDKTDFIRFTPHLNAFYSKDVYDFWRPNDRLTPVVDGKYSIQCYLDALESCVKDFKTNLKKYNKKEIGEFIDYYIYHLPFTRMVYKSHTKLLSLLNSDMSEEDIEKKYYEIYDEKIKPSLLGSEYVGNIYTGSVYMCLISILEAIGSNMEGKNIGVFSYGSGCGSEFFMVNIGAGIKKQKNIFNLADQIKRRKRITINEYEEIYADPLKQKPNYDLYKDIDNEYSKYKFIGVKNYKRNYTAR